MVVFIMILITKISQDYNITPEKHSGNANTYAAMFREEYRERGVCSKDTLK